MILIFSLLLSPVVGYLLYIKNKNLEIEKEIKTYLLFVWIVNFISMSISSLYVDDHKMINDLFELGFFVKYNILGCFVSIGIMLCINFLATQFVVDIKVVENKKKGKKISKS